MGPYYNSRVVIYDRKMFISLAIGLTCSSGSLSYLNVVMGNVSMGTVVPVAAPIVASIQNTFFRSCNNN